MAIATHPLAAANVRRVRDVEAALEGQALCNEAALAVEAVQAAIASRSWEAVYHQMNWLASLTIAYRHEFAQLAHDSEVAA